MIKILKLLVPLLIYSVKRYTQFFFLKIHSNHERFTDDTRALLVNFIHKAIFTNIKDQLSIDHLKEKASFTQLKTIFICSPFSVDHSICIINLAEVQSCHFPF